MIELSERDEAIAQEVSRMLYQFDCDAFPFKGMSHEEMAAAIVTYVRTAIKLYG